MRFSHFYIWAYRENVLLALGLVIGSNVSLQGGMTL